MLDRRHCLGLLAAGLFMPSGVVAQTVDKLLADKFPAKDPLANRFGGPFSLTDHNGHRVTEQSWPGQFKLVYFGFTRCTDACPIDLPNLVQGLDLVAPLDARIQPLFITVDSDDTPQILKTYVEAFHSRLLGLTGSEAELAALAKAYRVHRYRVEMKSGILPSFPVRQDQPEIIRVHGEKPHSPGQKFTINHGTLTYLMGPDGSFLTIVPHGAGGPRIAEVLRKYVKPA